MTPAFSLFSGHSIHLGDGRSWCAIPGQPDPEILAALAGHEYQGTCTHQMYIRLFQIYSF